MDLTITIYVLAALTLIGAVFAPIIAFILTIRSAGPPPDVAEKKEDAA